MIDTALKPWLLEVNASPSLSTTTATDKALKTALIGEVLDIVLPPNFFETRAGHTTPAAARRGMATADASSDGATGGTGGFEVLYDEAAEIELTKKEAAAAEKARGGKGPQTHRAGGGRSGVPSWAP